MPRKSSGHSSKLLFDLRGIETDFAPEHADTLRHDLGADFALANPPFDWFRRDEESVLTD